MTLEYKELEEAMEKKDVMRKRGTATINVVTGDVEFRAYNTGGDATQKNVVTAGNAKMYETVGDKTSSLIVHLKVNRESADPRAELYEQLEGVLKKAKMGSDTDKELRKVPRKCLSKNEGVLAIWFDCRQKKVIVQMMIDTEANTNLDKPLYDLTRMVSKCLYINQKSITGKK